MVNTAAHHGYFDKEYLFADVAVIGGGPAGLAAALQAAEAGAEVILIDDERAARRLADLCALRCRRPTRPGAWRTKLTRRLPRAATSAS